MPQHGTSGQSACPAPGTTRSTAASDNGEEPPESPREPRGLQYAFRSLRHRNYRLYFIGQLVSITGTWMQTTALTWLAYELTHESTWTALVSAAQVLPTFFFGAWGGALGDRFAKRHLLLVTQSIFLVTALLLAGLVMAGTISPWHLLIIMLLNGFVQAVDFPTRLSFVMDMAGREDLINAVALNSVQFNVARAVGPALGGAVLVLGGAAACFVANAVSFVAVLIALARMDVDGRPPRAAASKEAGSLRAGFAYLAARPSLAVLLLLAGAAAACGWPFLNLLPALAHKTIKAGEQGYSWMLSSTGFGALVAALAVAMFGSLSRRRQLIGIGLTIMVASLLGLGQVTSPSLAVLCCGLAGFGLVLFFATSQSVVQLSTADHNRGRIMGIWAMVLSGAIPLGTLVVGPAADRWGEPVVISYEGLLCAVAAVALLALLAVWRSVAGRRTEGLSDDTPELLSSTAQGAGSPALLLGMSDGHDHILDEAFPLAQANSKLD